MGLRFRYLLPFALLPALMPAPAPAAFEFSDIACVQSSTAGTGTLTLGSALDGYLTFSGAGITSGATVPYHIRSGGDLETGYGVYTDAASDTLTRDAAWSTDGQGAELNLTETSNVCIGPIANIFNGEGGFVVYQNDAGATGAVLPFDHDSASPAAADVVSAITSTGEDSAGSDVVYSTIDTEIRDTTDASEDARLEFFNMEAGSSDLKITLSDVLHLGTSNQTIIDTTLFGGSASTAPVQINSANIPLELGRWANAIGGPTLALVKSRSGTIGTYTVVQNGDGLGSIYFYGADSVDLAIGAAIQAYVDGSPGSNDMPGSICLAASGESGGGTTVTDRWCMGAAGTFAWTPQVQAAYDLGTSSLGVQDVYLAEDDDSSSGPSINFDADSASATTDDSLGELRFNGNDALGNNFFYGKMGVYVFDSTDATEDGYFFVSLGSAGTDATSNPTQLYLDAGEFFLQRTTTSSTGLDVNVFLSSSSPAAGDDLSTIEARGKDAGGNNTDYTNILSEIDDTTDTSEDGELTLRVAVAGTMTDMILIDASNIAMDSANFDFDMSAYDATAPWTMDLGGGNGGFPLSTIRVENDSTGTGQIRWYKESATPASADKAGIDLIWATGDSASATVVQTYASITATATDITDTSEDGTLNLNILVAGSTLAALTLGGTDSDGSFGHIINVGSTGAAVEHYGNSDGGLGSSIKMVHDSASPAAGDDVFWISTNSRTTTAVYQDMHYYYANVIDPTNNSEDTSWAWDLRRAGSLVTALELGGTDAHGVFSHVFNVSSVSNGSVEVQSVATGAEGPMLNLYHNTSSPADGDNIGYVLFAGENDVGATKQYAYVWADSIDVNDATSEDGQLKVNVLVADTSVTEMSIHDGVIIGGGGTFPGNSGDVRLYSSDDSTTGPVLQMHHDDPSADAGDDIARWEVFGGADDEEIASITLDGADVATGTEDTAWLHVVRVAGSDSTVLAVSSTATFGDSAEFFFQAGGSLGINDGNVISFYETEANGDNFQAMNPPDAITTDATCNFENDANFIPDSCVGDGSDASDGRLKKILNPANPIQVGRILDQIRIYDFEWTADSEKSEKVRKGDQGFGPIAQELFAVHADWVDVGGEDPVSQPWTWKPENIVPYLIVEIQSLRKRISDLERKGDYQ